MTPVYLVSMQRRPDFWLIEDASGVKHATKDAVVASVCREALDRELPVRLWSSGGWYYRDLQFAKLAAAVEGGAV